jgi:N-succinyldiaminopimelate aminotransferase
VAGPLQVSMPEGGFYFWARTPGDDAQFARELLRQMNVASLPGSFLARESNGVNPGAGYLRLALVSSLAECSEAIERIVSFLTTYDPKS